MQRDGFSSRTAPYGAVLYSHMSCGKRRWVLLQNAAAGGVLYSHIPVERRWVLFQNGALRRRSVLAYVLWKGDGFSSRTAPYGAVLYSHMSCGKRRWVLL